MIRQVLIASLFASLGAACSSTPDNPSAPELRFRGPLAFDTIVSGESANSLELTLRSGGIARKAMIDTGSIYYFQGTVNNSSTLSCEFPELYSYGGGAAHFCPSQAPLDLKTPEDAFENVATGNIVMGEAHFTEWPPPYGIVGLSGYVVGENKPGMVAVTEQLKPDFLSFTFPEGLLEDGFFQFDELDSVKSDAAVLPLVDPTTLGYGYSARFARFEYIVEGKVHTTIVNRYDDGGGVFLEHDGESHRIADDFISFFDTGTTIPLFPVNGDVSLLGDKVPSGTIMPEASAPNFESYNAIFEDVDGQEVMLKSGDLRKWWGPDGAGRLARVLTMAAVEAQAPDMVLYAPTVGLNFIGNYNFQFAFDDGTPTEATFSDRNSLYTGPMIFNASVSEGQTFGLTLPIRVQGQDRSATIDTGSVYYFQGSKDNTSNLPCGNPQRYSYGGGIAHYCPSEQFVEVEDPDSTYLALRKQKLNYGVTYFTDWPGPPYGIIGFSSNRTQQNHEFMSVVTEQLEPDYLSIAFPGGLQESGVIAFDKLASVSDDAVTIPLTSPKTLGYGYSALIERMDFIVGGAIHTSFVTEADGVYLEQGASKDRVADEMISFFDTGTTIPMDSFNGDISLLGLDTPAGAITPDMGAALYDEFTVTFKDVSGDEVTLSSGDVTGWQPGNASAHVPTKDVMPAGMKLLTNILGLNFIGQFDFQFTFKDGRATEVIFSPR